MMRHKRRCPAQVITFSEKDGQREKKEGGAMMDHNVRRLRLPHRSLSTTLHASTTPSVFSRWPSFSEKERNVSIAQVSSEEERNVSATQISPEEERSVNVTQISPEEERNANITQISSMTYIPGIGYESTLV